MLDASTGGDASWFQATARQRIAGFLDPGSFKEFLPPTERVRSPHLEQFDLPAAFDDGVIVGRGKIEGRDILLAAQEGQFMGAPSRKCPAPSSSACCAPRATMPPSRAR